MGEFVYVNPNSSPARFLTTEEFADGVGVMDPHPSGSVIDLSLERREVSPERGGRYADVTDMAGEVGASGESRCLSNSRSDGGDADARVFWEDPRCFASREEPPDVRTPASSRVGCTEELVKYDEIMFPATAFAAESPSMGGSAENMPLLMVASEKSTIKAAKAWGGKESRSMYRSGSGGVGKLDSVRPPRVPVDAGPASGGDW